MTKCTVCIDADITLQPLQCPEGLENPNHCIDVVTDRLLEKLTDKGFGVVYHAFGASHLKNSNEVEVKIELVFDKIYGSKTFETLGGSFSYHQTTYCKEFLNG